MSYESFIGEKNLWFLSKSFCQIENTFLFLLRFAHLKLLIPYQRPIVLSIGGFDPSGGAGVLADCKTFEVHDVMGISATTCITIQNENVFEKVYWFSQQQIIEQLEILFRVYKIEIVKIGLIENFELLQNLVEFLKQQNPCIKIIFDTVLKSSSGFDFYQNQAHQFLKLLNSFYLITPNYFEAQNLFQNIQPEKIIADLKTDCAILLKGGHQVGAEAIDLLFTNGKIYSFPLPRLIGFEKHGSGCVLSSAIAANLGLQMSLIKSCETAKKYTYHFLLSNKNKLGFHHKNGL